MSTTLIAILAVLLGLGFQNLGAALNSPPPGKAQYVISSVVLFVGFLLCLIIGVGGA